MARKSPAVAGACGCGCMRGGVQAQARPWCAEEVDLAVLMGVGQLATAPAPPRVLLCGGSPEEPCAAPPLLLLVHGGLSQDTHALHHDAKVVPEAAWVEWCEEVPSPRPVRGSSG